MLPHWLAVQSLVALKGLDYLTLLVFLWSPNPLRVPQSFPQLSHKTPWAPSDVCLWVSVFVSIGCWIQPLRDSCARLLSASITEYY